MVLKLAFRRVVLERKHPKEGPSKKDSLQLKQIDQRNRKFVQKLESKGHKCIVYIADRYPYMYLWCGKSKCAH